MNRPVPEFDATITWAEGGAPREYQIGERLIHPSRFPEDGDVWPAKESWSIVLELKHHVERGDEESDARIHFFMGNGPHHRLRAGRAFDFYIGPQLLGRVWIGERTGLVEADA